MIKAADPIPMPAWGANPENRLQARTLATLGKWGLGALGVGAALRGVQAIPGMIEGTHGDPPKVPLREQVLEVPVRRLKRPEEEKRALGPLGSLAKAAAGGPPMGTGERLAGTVLDKLKLFPEPGKAFASTDPRSWIMNPAGRDLMHHPWALPATFGLVGGGFMAGNALADHALDASQANETDSELEHAKRRFEATLKAAEAPAGEKAASSDPYAAIDRLYDRWEKAATLQDTVAPYTGFMLGAGGVGAVAGAMLAYHHARERSEDKVMNSALKRRRSELFAQAPPTLLAEPVPADDTPGPPGMKIRPIKAGALAGDAGGLLAKYRSQAAAKQQAFRETMGLADPKKPDPKPAAPAPPQLPSVIRK